MTKAIIISALLLSFLPCCGVKSPPLPPLPPEQAEKLRKEQAVKDQKDAELRKAIEEEEKTSGVKDDD